ncbi:MAG TPA: bifunctional diguanylate cyclase/phosphodiesterase [Ilumatobacter sp.]|nr:bifunctional diguanylate cyclase/phosphodiesterase [Ilumatobacter sp.]
MTAADRDQPPIRHAGAKPRTGALRELATRSLPERAATLVATVLLAVIATGLAVLIVQLELATGNRDVNWPVLAVVAAALFAGEVTDRWWITSGSVGVVTPRWMCTFGLLLVSTPLLALVVAVLAAVVTVNRQHEAPIAACTRISTTVAATCLAGLILRVSGIEGSITQYPDIGWGIGGAMVAAGAAILMMNALTGAFRVWVAGGAPLRVATMRELRGHLTADAALLSLAPIWVIGVSYSLVLIPLLTVTTVFVFRSTREAFDHARVARLDGLTGLLNGGAFRSEVAALYASRLARGELAIVLIDLDGFKEVNDQLGHEVGDRVLTVFAERMRATLPVNAVLARLGGDEFVAALPIQPDGSLPNRRNAEVIHTALTEPLQVDGFPIGVGVSLGVAVGSPDLATLADVLRAADAAMYRAKRLRSNVELYTPDQGGHGRVHLLTELGPALADHQFSVEYQPQLRIADGEVAGVEALIRWHHPEHGDIPPGAFIGLAEQTDLIAPITDLVLRLAASGMRTSTEGNLVLAVNVSARSLVDRRFAKRVLDVLDNIGLPPHRLEIEVTERALVTHPERSRYTIAAFREAGVRLAVDDFGCGYSSYHTLRDLDVDRIKIDRVFVAGMLTNPRDEAIVRSVVNLAHRLGIEAVGEGVENTGILHALSTTGCDVAQGYVIARPMALPELRGWLTRWGEARTRPDAPMLLLPDAPALPVRVRQ